MFKDSLCQIVCTNFVKWEISFNQKCTDIIKIPISIENIYKSFCRLIISGCMFLNENGVLHIQPASAILVIVILLVDKYKQTVSQPINFLSGRLERAR